MAREEGWEIAKEVASLESLGGWRGSVVRGKVAREEGGEESEPRVERGTEVEAIEEVQKVVGVDTVVLLFQGQDWLHTPQHKEVGIGQVTAGRVNFLRIVTEREVIMRRPPLQ